MNRLAEVTLIPRTRHADARGWLLKAIDGREPHLPAYTGEVYVTMAVPGQVRGNHYHRLASEWFTLLEGQALVVLADPATGERRELRLSASEPTTLFVPAGVAHVFVNPADSGTPMLLLAYADQLYDPSDTVRLDLV